ncbi:MAG: MFS transporter [Syntrophales bacterium]
MNVEIVFALVTGFNFGIIMMNIPPVLSEFMGLYGVSYTQISILISSLLWTHTIMQLPAGLIVDRLGVRRTQLISYLCMCIGSAIPVVSPVLGWGIAGRIVTGLGTGLGWLATLKMLAVSAPPGRGGAYQAFFAGLFSLGSILAFLYIPAIAAAGWQWVYLTPAILCFMQLCFVPVLRATPVADSRALLPLRSIVTRKAAWLLGLYHAVSYGAMMSFGNWLPSLLAEALPGRTATQLAWGGALVMLVSGLGRISGGFFIFRVSPYLVAHGSILGLCLLFGGLAIIPGPAVVLTLALLGAWFGSFVFGSLFQLANRSAPPESLGALLGFINFLANLGAAAFTLLFGWSKDELGSFTWAFAILCPLAAAALVAGWRGLGRKG